MIEQSIGELAREGPSLGDPRRLEDGIWSFGYKHARDIPDELFLEAIRVASKKFAEHMAWPTQCPANRWAVGGRFGRPPIDTYEEIPGVPSKVVLAKAKRLINRKIIDGCPCGCRGDFKIIGEV